MAIKKVLVDFMNTLEQHNYFKTELDTATVKELDVTDELVFELEKKLGEIMKIIRGALSKHDLQSIRE